MKIKLQLFSLFLFFSHFAFSQSDFRPGYVIMHSGDTLYGTIDYRGDLLMSSVCKFKAKEKGEAVEYFPQDIKAYRFEDSKYFVSKEVKTESGIQKVFLEFLIKGEINAYTFRDHYRQHYFIEKEGEGLAELPFEEEIRYKNNTAYLYQSKTHMGVLKYFMSDAPSLNSKIENFDKIEHKAIVKLTEEYHNQICPEERCIIYEKKMPLLRIHPELVLRSTNLYHKAVLANYIDRNYISAGVLLHLQMPRVNEKLYFTVGLLPISIERKFNTQRFTSRQEEESPDFVKIPLYFSYLYPKGPVKPRLSYGFNLYSPFHYPFAVTNSFTAGANIKLYKLLNLSVYAETEFYHHQNLPLIPHELLSYSFGTGLYFSF